MKISNVHTFLGLDVGEKRIGVARINSIAKIAEPLEHIEVKEQKDVFKSIHEAIKYHDVEAIVVGLPRSLDGHETDQTIATIDFANELKKAINIDVYMIDEAGTSKAADEIIKKSPLLSRDSVSACIILEDFINHNDKSNLKI
jgi:putative Holliday junction resolvase